MPEDSSQICSQITQSQKKFKLNIKMKIKIITLRSSLLCVPYLIEHIAHRSVSATGYTAMLVLCNERTTPLNFKAILENPLENRHHLTFRWKEIELRTQSSFGSSWQCTCSLLCFDCVLTFFFSSEYDNRLVPS